MAISLAEQCTLMRTMDIKTIINLITWTLVLSIFWLFLSGFFTPLLLTFGAVSVALVVYLLIRMNKLDGMPQKLSLSFSFMGYLIWLIGQIFVSSLKVVRLVWGDSKNVKPVIKKVSINNVKKSRRVLYANSITLTPGTLSVDIDEKHVTVHALDKASIESLESGEMAEIISKATGGKK